MTTLGNDTFTRANQSGWGTADDGQTWSVSTGAATLAISSNEGTVTACTTLTFIKLGSTTSADSEALVRIAVPTTNYTAAGILLRSTASNTAYRCRINSNSAAQGIGIIKTVAGTSTNLITASFTPTLNSFYWMRFKIVGSDLYGKIWADGSTEPTAWTVQTTDTSITGAGGIGIVNNTSNSADTAKYDHFYVVDYTPGSFSTLTSLDSSQSGGGTNTGTDTLTSLDASGSVTASSSGPVNSGTDQLFSFDAVSGTDLGTNTGTDTTQISDAAQEAGTNTGTDTLSSLDATGSASRTNISTDVLSITGVSGTNLGNNTGTSIVTTLDATGNAQSTAILPPASVTVKVAGVSVQIKEGSFSTDDTAAERSTCSFTVIDSTGTNHYYKGQQVQITHSILGATFTGVISTVKERNLYPNAEIHSSLQCVDAQWYADKRFVTGMDYTNQYAGDIVTDLLSLLTAEGITANYAARRDTTQSDFAQGTLSNVVATTNAGDGDLELAVAGATEQYFDGALTPSSQHAIKLKGTAIQGFNNNFVYRKIWQGSVTIASGDTLNYDVWIQSDSPAIQAGVDFSTADGISFRDATDHGLDAQGISPHPGADLSGYANNQWYSRSFTVGASMVGKTLDHFMVAFEGDSAGTYTAYFRNIQYKNGSTVKIHVLDSTQTTLQTNTQVSINGYTSVSLTNVTAYSNLLQQVATHSIDPVKLVKSSLISWNTGVVGASALPSDASVLVETSVDNGVTWQTATNNQSISNLLAGMNVASRSIKYRRSLLLGKDPTIAPTLTNSSVTIQPAYVSSKTDVVTTYDTQADFNTGSTSSTKTLSSGGVTLNGFTRNWDDANLSSQTLFGVSGSTQSIFTGQIALTNPGGGDTRSRLDFAGNWQNFIAEVDLQVMSKSGVNFSSGLVYRTSAWGNSNDSYAYCFSVSTTQVLLGKGTNSSGSGLFVQLGTAAINLSANTWHRLKVIVNGNSHQAYVDETLYLTVTDSTYTGTGNIGLRFWSTDSVTQTAYFDNFGVCSSLTGTWTSPSINIAGPGTYGNSVVLWDDSQVPDTATLLIESSIDGGSTYQTATNTGAIPNLTAGQSLSGKTVKYRATLTASNATEQPILPALSSWVMGQYTSSGTRVSPVLSLSNVGEAGSTLVSWNATTPTGTTLGVDISPDGTTWTDVSSSNGGSLPFITSRPAAIDDTFDTDTSSGYTATLRTGGAAATWTWDTANTRLVSSGGQEALLLFTSDTSFQDGEVLIDTDQADQAGIVLRYQDTNNYYDLAIYDSASTLNQSIVQLYRVSGGTRTLLTSSPITFPRGIFKRFKATASSNVISISLDGSTLFSYHDAAPISTAGKVGVRAGYASVAGTSHYSQLRIQNYGEDCTGQVAYSRLRLSSTDPTQTPQVLGLTVSAHNPDIGNGSLIPQTDYQYKKTVAEAIDDLAKQSDYWWTIDANKHLVFQERQGVPSAWILTDVSGDLLLSGLQVENSADLYRNRQYVIGGYDTGTFIEQRDGDGTTTSWAMGYPLAASPAITVNGQPMMVGVKGVDTGKDFYYELDSATITQDQSATPLASNQTLSVTYTGKFSVTVMVEDTIEQAAWAAKEGGSGIVEHVIDVSGQALAKAACQQIAQANLDRYKVVGRTLTFATRKHGLGVGQLLSVFVPEHGIVDGLFLINRVQTTLRTATIDGVEQLDSVYTIEASEGPYLGTWVKLFKKEA